MADDTTSPVARLEIAFKQLDLARRALDEGDPRYENIVELAYRAKGEGEALASERGEEWSPKVAPHEVPRDDVATDGGVGIGERPTTVREYRREIHDLLDADEAYSKLSRNGVMEAIIELSSEGRRVEEARLDTVREVALRRRLAREADFEYDPSSNRSLQFHKSELRRIYNALTTSRAVTDGGIVREYDSPHEKLRQEFEILLGQNNTILREMPAYTVGQLFQLVDAARRKYDVGLEEVREEEDGIRLLMLTGGEVSDEIAAAVGIDHPDQVGDLDVHMIDDRKMGGSQ